MGGEAEGDERVLGVLFLEVFEAVKEGVDVGFDEASLAGVDGFLESGAGVGDAEEDDADSDSLGGGDDAVGEFIGVGVGCAVGLVVKVVEFSDGGDTGHEHFEECEFGGGFDLFWGKGEGGVVHLLAP